MGAQALPISVACHSTDVWIKSIKWPNKKNNMSLPNQNIRFTYWWKNKLNFCTSVHISYSDNSGECCNSFFISEKNSTTYHIILTAVLMTSVLRSRMNLHLFIYIGLLSRNTCNLFDRYDFTRSLRKWQL